MTLKLKKQNLKKLNNKDAVAIDAKATQKVAGGYATVTGCFDKGCKVN